MKRLRELWLRLWRWWTGKVLNARLKDHSSPERNEAELAVERVVTQTNLAPDCVAATVIRGGPAILVRLDTSSEAFVHHSYALAAEQAIKWANARERRQAELKRSGNGNGQGQVSKLNRKQRRQFDKLRKKER